MISTTKAVIIEDEIPAARLLKSMIESIRPTWEVIVLPGNIEESVDWFNSNPHPDIIFLDIQLSDGNSFIFIEQAKPDSMIVFTTAYDEYAIRAFSLNSIDYLLKPIHLERLQNAITKFENLTSRYLKELNENNQVLEVLQSLSKPEKRYRTRFLISGVDRLFTLQVNDIAYFYSENKETFAVTTNAKEHIIELSLDKLCEQLDPDQFFRANRQTIVSIDAIKKIEPYFQNRISVAVHPPFKNKILVSKEKISSFKLWLNY
jgi:DNA-binding LytR/AlgR family response regulator